MENTVGRFGVGLLKKLGLGAQVMEFGAQNGDCF